MFTVSSPSPSFYRCFWTVKSWKSPKFTTAFSSVLTCRAWSFPAGSSFPELPLSTYLQWDTSWRSPAKVRTNCRLLEPTFVFHPPRTGALGLSSQWYWQLRSMRLAKFIPPVKVRCLAWKLRWIPQASSWAREEKWNRPLQFPWENSTGGAEGTPAKPMSTS